MKNGHEVFHTDRAASFPSIPGSPITPCEAIFLVSVQRQHHDFLEGMGCRLTDSEQAECDELGRTPIPGLFVAGNARKGLQLAMIAAPDGLRCAAAANDWLLERDT